MMSMPMPCARTSAPPPPGKPGISESSVIPVTDVNGLILLDRDETIRPKTDMQALAALKASFVQMGEMGGFDAVATAAHPDVEFVNHVHHAGNSSGIVDGAAAVLVGSKKGGKAAGLKPRARIRAFATIGSDLALMLTGPVDVTELVLRKSGMNTKDIDLFELNEAFSSVVLRYQQAFDIDDAVLNVNGGAIAMGHPLGATGAMILGTVLDELERTNKTTALVTLARRRHGRRDDHRAGLAQDLLPALILRSRAAASRRMVQEAPVDTGASFRRGPAARSSG